MRFLIQKVKKAKVEVEGKVVGQIQKGLLVFVGVSERDTLKDVKWMKEKLLNIRIFPDQENKMNLSIQDVKGELLIVSQFTLYADCKKGRRPSFIESAKPEYAQKLYKDLVDLIQKDWDKVETGSFGAHMEIELINDGPLTFWIDSKSV